MKFSYNWMAEMLRGLDVPPAELTRLITMKTAESEGVEAVGSHLETVCAAKVLSAEKIGKGHNQRVTVDTGRYGVKTVVCGAPNCREGIVTAYVPVGTVLDGREMHKIAIDGVESDGMLASGIELGLNRDSEGVLELELAPGDALPKCLPDTVIEIDNKSLTHRPDLWGHYGMAREVAAITGATLADPVDASLLPSGDAVVKVEIEDYDLCPRYSALVFENVKVQPSPLWLQYRLEAVGLNPINNIVDVTNFIMAELSQPMHAFDADKLQGDTIYVRRAKQGEVAAALNDESYTLDPSNLVIADSSGPVAIAGVIGGADSAISSSTTRIVFESANFNASSIRKTSSKIKLRTDASMRFEKAQDPVNTVRGLARAIALLQEVSPGIRLVGGLADAKRMPAAPPPIELEMGWLQRKLGRSIDATEVKQILTSLMFGVEETKPGTFSVSVPTWRATKDISIKDDLVEEVGRMIGYGSITPTAPLVQAAVAPENEERKFDRKLRARLTALGFTEVYNYSFISEQQAAAFGMKLEDQVTVANPIASDQTLMRSSLLPGIWKNIESNARHFAEFRFFEIGREIHKQREGLPDEVPHLVSVVFRKDDGVAGLMELKHLALALMPGADISADESVSYEHPARTATVVWHGVPVGRLFEFHPKMVTGRAAVLDIDLKKMRQLEPATTKYTPLRKYPTSAFDLSALSALREQAGTLQSKLAELGGADLVEIEFVRQYAGPPLPEDKKSVSFRLTVGSSSRTLNADEVSAIRGRIIDGMTALGYELRV